MSTDSVRSRRSFLRLMASCGGLALAPFASAAPSPLLRFHHTHTNEDLAFGYRDDGAYTAEEVAQFEHFLRDFRTGEQHAMDMHLPDILHAVAERIESGVTFEVISGYRSPATNAELHRKSSEVAEHSLHMQGKAIDVRVTGYPTAKLRDHALALKMGGVGYYAHSDFVHLDTGRVRRWTG
ncbi:MAG TPA: DUF882 domain-containing protein [Steroidobacteraceae bacterium]|nr:DUF882 domain-containing protein [Steroidobacteraceae bacterium]